MPAESEAQRRYLFATKGAAWAKKHHFDNKGPLPARVGMAEGGVAPGDLWQNQYQDPPGYYGPNGYPMFPYGPLPFAEQGAGGPNRTNTSSGEPSIGLYGGTDQNPTNWYNPLTNQGGQVASSGGEGQQYIEAPTNIYGQQIFDASGQPSNPIAPQEGATVPDFQPIGQVDIPPADMTPDPNAEPGQTQLPSGGEAYVGINDPEYNQPTDYSANSTPPSDTPPGLGDGLGGGGTYYGTPPPTISDYNPPPGPGYIPGGPTDVAMRGIGNVLGTVGGNVLIPGLGGLLLGRLGGSLGGLAHRAVYNTGGPGGLRTQPGQSGGPYGGVSRPPQGMGLWGTNPGNNPTEVKWARPERNFGDPISNSIDPNSPGTSGGGPLTSNPSEPGWIGGTPFGSSVRSLSMALPGSFSHLGEGSSGDVPFFGRFNLEQIMRGLPTQGRGPGDALSQFASFGGMHPAAGAVGMPMLPVSQWGGAGSGGLSAGASRFGPNGRQMGAFSGGGMVKPPQKPLQGYGTDTVKAALTPGELVLNQDQQSGVMPRPGMAHKLRGDQLAAIALAMRGKR